jgi:hypothetical protein
VQSRDDVSEGLGDGQSYNPANLLERQLSWLKLFDVCLLQDWSNALFLAAGEGHVEVVSALLRAGASVDAKDRVRTPRNWSHAIAGVLADLPDLNPFHYCMSTVRGGLSNTRNCHAVMCNIPVI